MSLLVRPRPRSRRTKASVMTYSDPIIQKNSTSKKSLVWIKASSKTWDDDTITTSDFQRALLKGERVNSLQTYAPSDPTVPHNRILAEANNNFRRCIMLGCHLIHEKHFWRDTVPRWQTAPAPRFTKLLSRVLRNIQVYDICQNNQSENSLGFTMTKGNAFQCHHQTAKGGDLCERYSNMESNLRQQYIDVGPVNELTVDELMRVNSASHEALLLADLLSESDG
ncbi:hypothetical protein Tco_0570543 [Tanacetum coccineum]